MSTVQQLIYKVKQLGVCLTEQNGQLIVKAPANVWTADIKRAVSEHKSEIIRLIATNNAQATSQGPTNAYISQRMLELGLKQLKAVEIANQKQAEEYALGDTLGSLPCEHKFKFIEYMLTTLKKHIFGERYKGEAPNALFVECWFLANHDLTIEQLFNASSEFVRLAKSANDCGDNAELKRLRAISEGVEGFRRFCLSNAEDGNNEVSH